MRFDEKARENLEAAERLLDTRDGEVSQLFNPAASRAYYAAYLATADLAQLAGLGFDSAQANYYKHDTLPDVAQSWGILDADLSDDLALLRDRRVKADYWEDNVDLEEASEALDLAGQFLELLGEEGGE